MFEDFLTSEECDILIQKAEPKIKASSVICKDGKNCVDTNYRTSEHAF